MPGNAACTSLKRRGPSSRDSTTRRHHRSPTRSRAACRGEVRAADRACPAVAADPRSGGCRAASDTHSW
jgi:hypothetical protein